MRRFFLIAVFVSLGFGAAKAQERLFDGVLGAAAGAIVAGPVGLVAGGITGATAGPAISSSWGLRARPVRYRRYRRHSHS